MFDVGVVQKIYPVPGLEVGIDGYYKIARDLLDDGQFGAAYVLTGFNYDRGENVGIELKSNYTNGNFRAYGNIAWAKQIATNVVSNQFLFGQDELNYIATHYIYTDHAQILTASAGASYFWNGTRFSASMIYGSGLRSGFANTDHLPSYTQVNLGRFARLQHCRAEQADHAAVRRRQPVRYDLRDQGRLGHRRVRAAIRAAPRFLCRCFPEAVSVSDDPAPAESRLPPQRVEWPRRLRWSMPGRLDELASRNETAALRAMLQSGRIAPETS